MERLTNSILDSMKRSAAVAGCLAMVLGSTACGKHDSSFSLLGDSNVFQQNTAQIQSKVDVLFVIDNSGSMQPSQQKLADNISRFFDKFDSKGFDYQIAVTTTDAYKVNFGSDASMAKFRDGTDSTSHTGVFVVRPSTPNKQQTFITNVLEGVYGSGDERAWQSMEAALSSPLNSGFNFPRSDAFLSIIVLSDADDLSNTGSATIDDGNSAHYYANPALIPIQHYIDFLDSKMGATAATRSSKYNVNAIGIFDDACKAQINSSENKLGIRYGALADATGGIKGSFCDDFGTILANISHRILELRTRFVLTSQPNPSTIKVAIDGTQVPRIATGAPQPWSGFYYDGSDNSITFYGDYIPGPGAAIAVSFDPNGLR